MPATETTKSKKSSRKPSSSVKGNRRYYSIAIGSDGDYFLNLYATSLDGVKKRLMKAERAFDTFIKSLERFNLELVDGQDDLIANPLDLLFDNRHYVRHLRHAYVKCICPGCGEWEWEELSEIEDCWKTCRRCGVDFHPLSIGDLQKFFAKRCKRCKKFIDCLFIPEAL